MNGRARFRAVGIAGALALVVGAVQTRAAPPEMAEVEREADHILQSMSELLGSAREFTFRADGFASEGDTIYMVVDDPAKADPSGPVSGVDQRHLAPAVSAHSAATVIGLGFRF